MAWLSPKGHCQVVRSPVSSPNIQTGATLLGPEAAATVAERVPDLVSEEVASTPDGGFAILPDAAIAPEMIYSADDANVQPPKLTYPQALSSAFSAPHQSMMNTLEVVVSERGTVEQVRLLDGPRRLPDVMLLSGAKAWRFEPAMNGDTPVRYRTILKWESVP